MKRLNTTLALGSISINVYQSSGHMINGMVIEVHVFNGTYLNIHLDQAMNSADTQQGLLFLSFRMN